MSRGIVPSDGGLALQLVPQRAFPMEYNPHCPDCTLIAPALSKATAATATFAAGRRPWSFSRSLSTALYFSGFQCAQVLSKGDQAGCLKPVGTWGRALRCQGNLGVNGFTGHFQKEQQAWSIAWKCSSEWATFTDVPGSEGCRSHSSPWCGLGGQRELMECPACSGPTS